MRIPSLSFLAVLTACFGAMAHAQGPALAYQQPDPALTRIADAPLTPQVSLSPDQETMLVVQLQSLPTIAELALLVRAAAPGRYRAIERVAAGGLAVGVDAAGVALTGSEVAVDWSESGWIGDSSMRRV